MLQVMAIGVVSCLARGGGTANLFLVLQEASLLMLIGLVGVPFILFIALKTKSDLSLSHIFSSFG